MNVKKRIWQTWSKRRLPQVNGRIYLPHLQQPVTIYRDKWGVPHLQANNRHDLFLAQGFVHAQDRLWQLELNRRVAKGQLSALFGPLTLDTDRLAHTLGFARLAQADWETLPAQQQADIVAYTAGINAYLANKPPLPPELALLRHRPAPWHVLDSLAYGRLQMWALTHGAMGELIHAQLLKHLDPQQAQELQPQYPTENPVTIPDQLLINLLQPPLTNQYFGKGSLDAAGRGSNAWVIAPHRSSTGHAILCNDMHLPMGTPSLWHYQHLQSDDGLHVAGFSQPGLPYIMAGHNAHIAWGITLAYTDCEDFFIEQLNPDEPTQYRYQDKWHQAEQFEARITVRGQDDHLERIIVTHHGPIISDVLPTSVEEPATAIALRSIALQPVICFEGFALLNEAANWDDFVRSIAHIQAPSLNFLYADQQGNIGHWVSGSVPIRAEGDGLLPAPGWTGTHEWVDTIPFAHMPHAFNPPQGYIISANHCLVNEAAYPYYLGRVWRSGYRAQRIEALINERQSISLADCEHFQLDVYTIPGQVIVDHLTNLAPTDADAHLSLQRLRQWDGYLTPTTIGGTIYQVFLRQLVEALLAPHFPADFIHHYLGVGLHPNLAPVNELQGYWSATLVRWLQTPGTNWLPAGAKRTALLVDCLAQTTTFLRQQLGPDPNQWQWGRLHQVRFPHAFSSIRPLDAIFSHGPFPIGGDMDTVAQTGIRGDAPYDNNAISISSRHIIDLGDWNQARAMLTPGQSGHLGSPHYGDLIQPWLEGRYFPMVWEAVTAVAQHQLQLRPSLK